jgi:tape measure domain-containing protein
MNVEQYVIELNDKFSAELKGIKKEMEKFDKEVKKTENSFSSLSKKVGAVALVAGLGKLTMGAVKQAGAFEQTQIAFETFLGSAEKGKALFADLNKFANETPFNNEEVLAAGKSMLSAGVAAEDVAKKLRTIGDVASGAGVPLTDMSSIYAKAMNKGRVQAEELNQLAERGVPILDEFAKMFGVTKAEVMKMGEKGQLTSDLLETAFDNMTKEGGRFHNLMAKQSKTTLGLMSTLEGETQLLNAAIGKKLKPSTDRLVMSMSNLVRQATSYLDTEMEDNIQKERMEVTKLVSELQYGEPTRERQVEIYEELKKISPDIVDGLDKENMNMDKLNLNLEKYNENVLKRLKLIRIEKKEKQLSLKEDKAGMSLLDVEDELARNAKGFNEEDYKKALGLIKRNDVAGLQSLLTKVGPQTVGGAAIRKAMTNLRKLKDIAQQRADLEQQKELLGGNEIKKPTSPTSPISPIKPKIDKKDIESQMATITGAAPKIFNINIEKLQGIENFINSKASVKESKEDITKVLTDVMLGMLADVQIARG